MSVLEELRPITTIAIDTGEVEAIEKWKPVDATTNPSLILAASKNPRYSELIDEAVEYARKQGGERGGEALMSRLFVNFGKRILEIIPGRVSTEVDAELSFDVEGSIRKARELIGLYAEVGVPKERVLIKLASTWEGVQAARTLENEGIHCNMTLMFSLVQAAACAEAGATLISPFVGRILDWHKEKNPAATYGPEEDPGVLSVKKIYAYLKGHGYATQVMGASFRNAEEILELAGCDLLTISPQLLGELEAMPGPLKRKLSSEMVQYYPKKLPLDEPSFRYLLNEDQMATEKLADGIRRFAADANKLKEHLLPRVL